MSAPGDPYFSKTLDKGLKVLGLFNEYHPEYSQTEISRALDINMTSTYRLTSTLVGLGYLEKDKKSKRIRLGRRAMVMAATLLRTFDVPRSIHDLVDQVHDRHNITIDVALAAEDTLTILYRREAEETLIYRLPSVSRAWHTTSLGKAYLAFLSEDELEAKIRALAWEPRTPKSITDHAGLMAELDRTRRWGFAVADEEFLPGLITMGAPLIRPDTGEVLGAVSFDFSTIVHTVETMSETYRDLLLSLSSNLSEMLRAV
jgi:DNA-binding IclR family transcriptional regulator